MNISFKRLKILHYPANFPDPAYGQPFNMVFIAEHVHAAAAHHDHVVLYVSPLASRSGWVEVSRMEEAYGRVIRIHTLRTKMELLDRVLVYGSVSLELLRLFLGGFVPDVIHAHIFSTAKIPASLSAVLRIPLVVTEHWSALCRVGTLATARLRDAKKVYEQARIVLPVSDCLRHCIEVNTGAKFTSRIVFNAVDTMLFYRDFRARKKQIISVMRLEPPKDAPTLLRGFALIKDKSVTLKIVGRGDAQPLIELSRELGILERVEFLGEQNKTMIAELMRDSAVFALSSLWENSPCVIGEALCCGLPVVATEVGGIPELMAPADGRLVPSSQPEAMARALEEILEHPQQFNDREIADRARARFGYETIGAQLDEVYREAARG